VVIPERITHDDAVHHTRQHARVGICSMGRIDDDRLKFARSFLSDSGRADTIGWWPRYWTIGS